MTDKSATMVRHYIQPYRGIPLTGEWLQVRVVFPPGGKSQTESYLKTIFPGPCRKNGREIITRNYGFFLILNMK